MTDITQENVTRILEKLRAKDVPLISSGSYSDTRKLIAESAEMLEALSARVAELEELLKDES
jgi:hypothetical protein